LPTPAISLETTIYRHPDFSLPDSVSRMGQNNRSQLKTGELVAVKVQRPDLLPQIALDIYILRYSAAWVQKTFKVIRSDLVALIDEVASRLFEEIDYRHEAANADRFAKLYSHIKTIYVPRIYWEYTSHRILTMEWISGIKLTQVKTLRDRLVEEIVSSLEEVSQNLLKNAAQWFANPMNSLPIETSESASLENLQRVGRIIQESPSFAQIYVEEIWGLLLKPETQNLGQEIASKWARRIYYFIRN